MPFSFLVHWKDRTRKPEVFTEDEKWTVEGDDIVFTLTSADGVTKSTRIAMADVDRIEPWRPAPSNP